MKAVALYTAIFLSFSTFAIANSDNAKSWTATSENKGTSVKIITGAISCAAEGSPGPCIDSIELTVGRNSLLVPRSAYLDICQPTLVTIKFDGKSGIVTLEGGDGAESYMAKIFFDQTKVTRRILSSSIVNMPTEETLYTLRILKDEK